MQMLERHVQKHVVKTYESDYKNDLKISKLFSLFQDAAESNIDNFDIGYDYLMQNNLCWVAYDYHIKFIKNPKRNDELTIQTWPNDKISLYARRDFIVKNSDDEVLLTAASRWVLIDFVRKRPVSFQKVFPELPYMEGHAMETDFEKIEVPDRVDFETVITTRYEDYDVNKHVNNAVYPSLALDAVPVEFREQREIEELQINFKSETKMGENMTIQTKIDDNISVHHIFEKESGRTIGLIRVKWRLI